MPFHRTQLVALHAAAILMSGLSLAGIPATPAAAHSLEDVQEMLNAKESYVQFVDQPAPEFTLKDGDGRSVALQDFRGKVVVLYFIYANCPDVCPLQSEKLARIRAQINQTPMRGIVQFIAITTDPERDTSKVMTEYGPSHGLDPVNWMFLTSSSEKPDATRQLADAYGLKFTREEDGYQMHGVVTHLIDKSGRLRARFHGLKFHDTNFIVYVNALTNDTH
jgi:protein SCO1/2